MKLQAYVNKNCKSFCIVVNEMQINTVKVTQYLQRTTFLEFFFRLNERSAKCLSFPQKGKQNVEMRASYFV